VKKDELTLEGIKQFYIAIEREVNFTFQYFHHDWIINEDLLVHLFD
jgi:hypothetical protein